MSKGGGLKGKGMGSVEDVTNTGGCAIKAVDSGREAGGEIVLVFTMVDREEGIYWFERTEPLAAMHQAMSYRSLLGPLDPSERWQFGSALAAWVIRALRAPAIST